MELFNLVKTTTTPKKRIGRGHGSGKVKTGGRGTKGQNARGKMSPGFEGGQLALIRRLPFKKGKGRNNPLKKNPLVINLKYLNIFPKDTVVDDKKLIELKMVEESELKKFGVKILGEGELTVPLTIKLPCSHSAEKKILKAGGKVIGK